MFLVSQARIFYSRLFILLAVLSTSLSAIAQPSIFAGAGVTGGPRVQGRNVAANYAPNFDQFAYEDTFRGGTSVAFGDVDSDGVPDLITGPGDGGGPRLRVFSGRCLRNNQICGMADLFVGDPNYRGGITVASCDVDKDGFADVVIGQNQYVAVISGERLRVGVYAKMFEQSGFPGQVGTETPVACGDFNGDGYGDIANSMGNGNGPVVRVYNGERARFNQTNQVFYQFVFDPGDRFPVHLAAGDVNGDGRADLAVSAGIGGAPRVRIMNGQPLFSNQLSVFYDNYVLDPNTRGGVFVGIADLIADGKADLLIGAGAQAGGYVRVFDGAAASGNGSVDRGTYQPYEPNFVGGIWVAGADLTLPQCSDGIDNDGDGAVDLNDFSCLGNIKKNDEFRPFSQCYDGQDNDNDGLVDTDDPGCGGNRQNNNEGAATSQCQDGADNDGDGVTDRADPGCWVNPNDPNSYDRTRNNEAAATTQCQDSFDNDNDGVVDRADPGCWTNPNDPNSYDRTRNNEAAATTQCQDGVDNDADGAVDLGDFSCQGNRTKNDESNPKAQCQDGRDNDNDGLIDLADPGCRNNPQNNDESSATTQCQDGRDNDNDGVIDRADPGCWTNPADPSTYSPVRDNEAAATTQCQDGIDNDGDGVADRADPGCYTTPSNPATYDRTRNNEAAATTQCQDGIDNDGDIVADRADPGCYTTVSDPSTYDRTRNNEAAATTQCQDGIDNDRDGAIDLADFSCQGNRTKNDESTPVSQCQDSRDNDGDGLIDLADPGCGNNAQNNSELNATQCSDGIDNDQDSFIDLNDPDCVDSNDNNETGSGPSILPIVECVQENGDGTFTAYFGYESLLAQGTTIASGIVAGTNERTFNTILPAPVSQKTITSFDSGRRIGVNPVVFSGNSVTWILRPSGGQGKAATASRTSPRCQAIEPSIACASPVTGGSDLSTTFGYKNLNGFDIVIPVGNLNAFSPGIQNRGQPTTFATGTFATVFEVRPITLATTWTVGAKSVQITSTLPSCQATCVNVVNRTTKAELDSVALELASLTTKAADQLAKVVKTREVQRDVLRAKRRANDFVVEANKLSLKIPDISQTCADAPAQCVQEDNGATIDALKKLHASQRGAVQRFVARANFRENGTTIRNKPLVVSAKAAEKRGADALAKTPRVQTDCTNTK